MSTCYNHFGAVKSIVADRGGLRRPHLRTVQWRLGGDVCILDSDSNQAWIGPPSAKPPQLRDANTDTLSTPIRRPERVFLHVAHDCNLCCSYCYGNAGTFGGQKQWMSWDIARASLRWISSVATNRTPEIVFFGGEPWLNIELIERIVSEFPNLIYSVVTNGTLFDSRIARVAEKGGISALVSIDGPANVHDSYRHGPQGEGSYNRIVNNLSAMRKSYRTIAARAVYDHIGSLVDNLQHLVDLGFADIAFRPRWHGMMSKASTHLGDQLPSVVAWYFDLTRRKGNIHIRPLEGVLRRLLSGKRTLDFCRFGAVLSIAPDGRAYPCTHFVGLPTFFLGSVCNPSELERGICQLITSLNERSDPCDECWALPFCGRGCKAECFGLNESLVGGDGFCSERKSIVKEFLAKIIEAERNGAIVSSLGVAPNTTGGNRWGCGEKSI